MIVDEQIQSYRISLELTKPLQSGFVGTMKLIIKFFVNSGFDPEFVEQVTWMCDITGEQPITSLG